MKQANRTAMVISILVCGIILFFTILALTQAGQDVRHEHRVAANPPTATPTMVPLPYMQTSEAGRAKAEATQLVLISTIQAGNKTPTPKGP